MHMVPTPLRNKARRDARVADRQLALEQTAAREAADRIFWDTREAELRASAPARDAARSIRNARLQAESDAAIAAWIAARQPTAADVILTEQELEDLIQ